MDVKSKRIAKNTLLLYARMIATMFIGIYTSRVILEALGVEDYGIYNVVGGFVGMFGLISGSLSSSIGRFITFELGKGNIERVNLVFSSAIIIQVIMISITVLALEVLGVWFLNNKLTIPVDRLPIANFVFQFSLLVLVIDAISIPYNATIIAHEKMSAFAYISIYQSVAALLVAIAVKNASFDHLLLYSVLTFLISVSVRLMYGTYCKRHFEECRFRLVFDKPLLKEMFAFSSWNFIGLLSGVLRDSGGNILINVFFNPAVNAARAVAMQVNSSIGRFVDGFLMAVNPQITKSYAMKDFDYLHKLICQSIRLSQYLFLLISLPIVFNIDYILDIWLKEVPEQTNIFVILIVLFTLSEIFSRPLISAMLATGKIRNYQIIVGGVQLLNLPLSYIVLILGGPAYSILIVAIILSQVCLFLRLYMLRGMIKLSIYKYISNVYFNVGKVVLLSMIMPIILGYLIDNNFLLFIVKCILTLLSSGLIILFIGCTKSDRLIVKCKIRNTIRKFSR